MPDLFSSSLVHVTSRILDPMVSSRDAAIVLLHGGWTDPEVFSSLIPRLERAGYSVISPALPSSGTTPAVPSFDDDVRVIRHAVKSLIDTGKQVVVVMHSYGAVPGCEALRDLEYIGKPNPNAAHKGCVIKLVFLAAMVLPVGMSTWDPKKGTAAITGFQCKDDLISVLDGKTRFYNDLPVAEAEYWTLKLKSQSRLALNSRLTYPAYKYIPSAYLFTAKDMALPLKTQQRFVELANIAETATLDSGHAPHLSQPAAVERFIRQSAGESLSSL